MTVLSIIQEIISNQKTVSFHTLMCSPTYPNLCDFCDSDCGFLVFHDNKFWHMFRNHFVCHNVPNVEEVSCYFLMPFIDFMLYYNRQNPLNNNKHTNRVSRTVKFIFMSITMYDTMPVFVEFHYSVFLFTFVCQLQNNLVCLKWWLFLGD